MSREDPRVWCLRELVSVLQPNGFWLCLSLCRGLQSAPNVSHYSVWKTSYSFRFFTSSYIRGNPIFHISFCFVDVIVKDAGSQATGLFWLWSAWPQLIVNGEQMKEIFTNFMGIQAGPKPFLMPPFTVNVYWTLNSTVYFNIYIVLGFSLFWGSKMTFFFSALSSSLPFCNFPFFCITKSAATSKNPTQIPKLQL